MSNGKHEMIKAIIISLCMAVTLTACTPAEEFIWSVREIAYMMESRTEELFKSREEKAKEQSLVIMRHLISKNKEGLRELLAQEVLEQENVDEQIAGVFGFIDGNITSFSAAKDSTQDALCFVVEDIRTDTGMIFSLIYTIDIEEKICYLRLYDEGSGEEIR